MKLAMNVEDGSAMCLWKWRSSRACLLALLLIVTPIVYFIGERYQGLSASMISSYYTLEQMRAFAFKNSIATDYKPHYYTRWNLSFNRMLEDLDNKFDMSANDVIVVVHIQKTAGTSFEKFLVKNLNVSNPCACKMGKKRCSCLVPGSKNKIWLFSRYSTGWMCGLHADYTELFVSGCVDNALDRKEGAHRKRRYFYTSILREPISRFISEYRHVERGATWLAARHMCNGRPPTPEQLPLCFDPDTGWDGVSLDQFLACPFNLAFNRQTRMLADLTLVNCYNTTSMEKRTRDKLMLESAKINLRNLAFFGLKERMADTQWMFEQLFQLRFTKDLSVWKRSKSNNTEVSTQQLEMIKQKNSLDIQLYAFAEKLFSKRLKQLRSDDYATNGELKPNHTSANKQQSVIEVTSASSEKAAPTIVEYVEGMGERHKTDLESDTVNVDWNSAEEDSDEQTDDNDPYEA